MRGLRLLTLAPRVHERGAVLRAWTSPLIRLLSLGMIRREVVVDRRARYVTIDARYAWIVRRKRVIPFAHIHRIEYDYERTTTSLRRGYFGSVQSGDEVESFRVGLVLRPRTDVPDSHAHLYEERVHLFSFFGDGRGQAAVLDLEGQQEALSRRYVERLRALTGVGFGHELPQLRDEIGQAWSCERCQRPGPPRAGRCYYCGADLVANSGAD
ncbi:MAG: hypothetical protein R6X02_02705 [Enhygromyxa sp.]